MKTHCCRNSETILIHTKTYGCHLLDKVRIFVAIAKNPIEICTEEEISICIYVYLILISIQFVLFFCTNFDVSKNCVLRSLPVPLPRRSQAYCFSRLWQTEDNANKKFTNGCQYKFIETIITTEKYTLQDTDKGTLRFTTSISLSQSAPLLAQTHNG